MPRVKAMSAEECILDGFQGTRQGRNFKDKTDEFYIGYIVAITNIHNPNQMHTLGDYENAARKLVGEGKL